MGVEVVSRVQELLRAADLKAVALASPDAIRYVSGVQLPLPIWAGTAMAGGVPMVMMGAHESQGPLLVLANTEAWTVAEAESGPGFAQPYTAFDGVRAVNARAAYHDAVAEVWRRLELGNDACRVGLDKAVPFFIADHLKRYTPKIEFVDVEPTLGAARRLKTFEEVAKLRAAVKVNDLGQKAFGECAVPGITELDLWAAIVSRIQSAVGGRLMVTGELVSGPRTATVNYPGGPTRRRIESGDTAILDLSVCVDGYWSDTTNTVVVGASATSRQLTCFQAAREAFEAGLAALQPGTPCSAVEGVIRDCLARSGFKTVHYVGHQIGTSVNEAPRLVAYESNAIEVSMVFALEPGAYEGPAGTTGARLEKNILVTAAGPEVLSEFDWGITDER